jgi:plastocyanin domain-containing protein
MYKKSFVALLTFVLVVTMAISACAQAKKAGEPQTAKVTVNANGFEPASLNLKANVPAKITFTRTSNETCATEVVMPDYKIKQDLPLNKAVVVEFTPTKTGTMAFACGMNMFKGKIIVAQ